MQRHPHRDMEIFSYVIDGQLSHQDSMGNKEALPRGSVQYISAGTGITHSVRRARLDDGWEGLILTSCSRSGRRGMN